MGDFFDGFWLYFQLGLEHVLDADAYDHVLFVAALVAAFSISQWKKVVGLVLMFTLGHTISLGLAVYDVVKLNSNWVEFLIPVSIILTAVYHILNAGKTPSKHSILYLVTLFFGLVHGFGFASYFLMIAGAETSKLLVLLEFSLGIETAHFIVVLLVWLLSFLFQNVLRFSKRDWVIAISFLIIGLAIPILRENWILS